MTPPVTLVERLAALPKLQDIPRSELEWLAAHGELESHAAGEVVAPKGRRVHYLSIVLSGQVTTQADHGTGPRWVADIGPGEITGMLPYSRMKGPPADSYVGEDTEALKLHEDLFPELVHRCPAFTAHTVHHMLDRARKFKVSDVRDEKMLSLGKLAAGLAHEINNPASAAVRGAKHLRTLLADLADASRDLGATGLSPEALAAIERTRRVCMAHPDDTIRSPIEQADREDEIAEWLARHGADGAHAEPLAETSVTLEGLDALAAAVPAPALDPALRWIATGCTTQSLTRDIEDAATRIHELVSAVKRFTYMDAAAGAEAVDVVAGLRDTIRVLAAKARERQASVSLEAAPDLPRAHAIGNEMNQVWLNLLDNALDAVEPSGHVTIGVRPEKDRVVVRVTDDGHGIPADVLPRIFDPFFTTKPQGEGTGLGLEITRQLVRGSKGDITVRSRPGHTEFRVSLPREEPAR
jgi:signal transduction histidine kinase